MRYVASSLIAGLLTVNVVDVIRNAHVLPGYPGLPSGHEAFVATVGTSLVVADRRWLVFALVLCVVMAVSLVLARFHVWIDPVGSLVYTPPVTALFHWWFRSRYPTWQNRSSNP
jgi:membrane-associated phospholipid phosphatase